MPLLEHLSTEDDLEDRLSTPTEADIACCGRLNGDVLILGAGGKMGRRSRGASCAPPPLRYSVLVDIARAVKAHQPVDRTVSHMNVIWQGDANSYALRALEGCISPARLLNVTGPETLAVSDVAELFGQRFGVQPVFRGDPRGEALLSDARVCHEWLGLPQVSASELMDAVASWVEHVGRLLDKPTQFEVIDGKF